MLWSFALLESRRRSSSVASKARIFHLALRARGSHANRDGPQRLVSIHGASHEMCTLREDFLRAVFMAYRESLENAYLSKQKRLISECIHRPRPQDYHCFSVSSFNVLSVLNNS